MGHRVIYVCDVCDTEFPDKPGVSAHAQTTPIRLQGVRNDGNGSVDTRTQRVEFGYYGPQLDVCDACVRRWLVPLAKFLADKQKPAP